MRKSFLLLAFTFSMICNAQDFKTIIGNTSYGLKGGLNIADYIATPSHTVNLRLAPYLGGFAEYEIKEGFFFRPELLLSLMGGEQHTFLINSTNPEYVSREKLSYLSLPLNAKYYFNNFSVSAGPQLGFRLTAKYKYQIVDNGVVDYENTADIKDSRKFFDFGINLGAGYSITKKIEAELRYYYGLTTINPGTSRTSLHNSVIQIGLSYSLK